MMDNPGSSALMSGAESQASGTSFAIRFGGGSNSAELLAPEDGGLWRCFAGEKLSKVELRMGAWHPEPRYNRQTCIDDIDFDTDAQLGDDPHQGQ